jgi:hypothetical protein
MGKVKGLNILPFTFTLLLYFSLFLFTLILLKSMVWSLSNEE